MREACPRVATFIDWSRVFSHIEIAIMKNMRNEERGVQDFFMEMQNIPEEEQLVKCEKFKEFSSELMKAIMKNIDQMILDIEAEVSCFKVEMTHEGELILRAIAMGLLSQLLFFIEHIKSKKPLLNFKRTKENEK